MWFWAAHFGVPVIEVRFYCGTVVEANEGGAWLFIAAPSVVNIKTLCRLFVCGVVLAALTPDEILPKRMYQYVEI